MARGARDHAIAPDGSPVELYARLVPMGEPEIIHGAVPPYSEILELGCGAGRITHRLLELGHRVVAVDESPEMLAHVRRAEKIRGDIATLNLGRGFDAVVLASNLVNTEEVERRRAFLATCRRHVSDEGVVLIERIDPQLHGWVEGSSAMRGGMQIVLRDVEVEGRVVSAAVEYRVDDGSWEHRFTARLLDDRELERALRAAHLGLQAFLDRQRRWLSAVPVVP